MKQCVFTQARPVRDMASNKSRGVFLPGLCACQSFIPNQCP
jgi:hypothetical protein